MRKRVFLVLLVGSVLPLIGVIVVLHFLTLDQQKLLAQRRLASVVSGVVGFYDRAGSDILAQINTLSEGDDLKRTLLLTDEIGFIDQAALIKTTVDQQKLLNLDYLTIADPQGMVLAQGQEPTIFGQSIRGDSLVAEALGGQQVHSLGSRDINGKSEFMMLAASPVWFKNRVIGVVSGGRIIDENYLNDIKALAGAELIMAMNGTIIMKTIPGEFDKLVIQTAGGRITSTEIGGTYYKFGSFPLDDFSGGKIADLLIGIDTSDLKTAFDKISLVLIIFACSGFILAAILAWSFAGRIARPIMELAELSGRLATGDFDLEITSTRKDELGTLMRSFGAMAADLKEYQRKLIDSERMAAFTQMAQKVAHEIKNPLTPIQVSVQDLKRSYQENDSEFPRILENSCNTVLEEVSSLARIVREFSEFARFPAPNLAIEDLNSLMASLGTLYAADIEKGRFVLNLERGRLPVKIDRDQVKRAVHNVLKNAFEASGEAGKTTLKTFEENGRAVIEVADSGPGFSAQAKKNLFSPYFTTKSGGSGLGLVIVKKIITEHDGTIEIADEVGVGSKVKLKLKIYEPENPPRR